MPTRRRSQASRDTAKWFGFVRASALAIGLVTGAGVMSGCRVSETDVHRWEGTERGPFKLVAVIEHDKYAWPLRIEAALSLIRMPPRGGQRQGIKFLVGPYKDEDGVERPGALMQVTDEARRKIVDGMEPEILRELQAPPPAKHPDGTLPPDTSIPYKDAAFAMLSHEPPLVTNDATKKQLGDALVQWAQTDFEDRIENATQQYGIEQMMRFLGAPSVKGLPGLMTVDAYRIDRMAGLISDIGDPETKQKASEALVALAKKVESADWVTKETQIVDEHNKKAAPNTPVTKEQVAKQVQTIQERKLNEEVFPAMKRVGGRPVIDFLIAYAGDGKKSEDKRKLALAALEGRVDKSNTQDVDRLFAIAKEDATPDGVRDLTFARLGELPKEQIVPRIYAEPAFFTPKKWKVRWVAASLVLKTMTTKGVAQFMGHLPATPAVKMGMTEPLSYGGIIAKMEAPAGEPKPRDVILPYLGSHDFGAKMTAFGYFYNGKKSDIAVVKTHEGDPTPLPKCDKDDDCGWTYDVVKAGSQDREQKPVTTVGEFVKLVLIPSMDQN